MAGGGLMGAEPGPLFFEANGFSTARSCGRDCESLIGRLKKTCFEKLTGNVVRVRSGLQTN